MVKAEIFGPDTYDSCANRVKKLTGILLIFHPGCGHCVQMRPEWDEMKRRLSSDTKVIEIDGSEMSGHDSLQKSALIQRTRGFPSIFHVKDGKFAAEFQGSRTANELVQFANAQKRKRKIGSKTRSISRKARRTKRRKIMK